MIADNEPSLSTKGPSDSTRGRSDSTRELSDSTRGLSDSTREPTMSAGESTELLMSNNDSEENDNFIDVSNDGSNINDSSEEIEEVINIEKESKEFLNWARDKMPEDCNVEAFPLTFQQFDIDSYISKEPIPKSVIRLYGVNEMGYSIVAHVHGFLPYLYIKPPCEFQETECEEFCMALNTLLNDQINQQNEIQNLVVKIEYCKKTSIYGFFKGENLPFLKVFFSLPKLVSKCKRLLEKEIQIPNHGIQTLAVFDTDIDFLIRFMVDSGLVGCSWVEFPSDTFKLRQADDKMSFCQIEVDIDWKQINYHCPKENVAPIRILSFDIKCASRKGCFPDPEKDSVIQISNVIIRFGEKEPFLKNIFTLNSCGRIVGTTVITHDTEKELLIHWSQFIRVVDPDFLTGYNIQNLSLPYLINRSKNLKLRDFYFLGRIKSVPSKITESRLQSKQMGRRDNKIVHMTGRVQFDLLLILYRDYKLRSYSLNAVSFHFLEEQKEEFSPLTIDNLQNGNELSRRRLAVYSLKESQLVLRLIHKLMCFINYIEMSRVTGVPFSYLLSHGQSIKVNFKYLFHVYKIIRQVLSQLLRKAATQNYILPNYKASNDDKFAGGFVLDPIKGFYKNPIVTLDFASLYPSIMMRHNLCYTTWIRNFNLIQQLDIQSNEYTKTPSGSYFVTSSVKRGLLPDILTDLLDARKRAKKELATETDPFKKQVLDGRQLALKASANSVYGFTGAQIGRLPCLDISSSVTAFGREMIQFTKDTVEATFLQKNGYPKDVKVIYGDTDSIMCNFKVDTVKEAIDLGKESADLISSKFLPPIKMEFERVSFPYLLISKKKYAGITYTKPDKFDNMDCKGLENVRRDNCPLVGNVMNNCLRKLLIDRDPEAALQYAQSVITDLMCNRIDISQLIITKELTKTDSPSKSAHLELVNKLRRRDPGSAPKLGDRVPYVITTTGDKTKMYTRSEDPLYVLDNNISIDTDYYLKNQLTNPLTRIFEPIFGKETTKKKLFSGEHLMTRTKQIANLSMMSKFTVVKPKCLGCKVILGEHQKSLCNYCQRDSSALYCREVWKFASLEKEFCRLWTQCQRCSGSLLQEVLCSSRDCPIFYMRKKVQIDLIAQDEIVQMLDKDLEW